MKIFGVGKNYYPADRTSVDPSTLPSEPVIFCKADSSLLHNHKPFFVPEFMGRVDYEGEIVVRINRLGKNIAEEYADRYYDAVTMGIDFTAKDYLHRARAAGNPWDISKGFDGASVIGEWVPKEQFDDVNNIAFTLDINGERRQTGNTQDMIFSLHRLISYISQFCTLRTGDILFTGTPAGAGPVAVGDHFVGTVARQVLLDFPCR